MTVFTGTNGPDSALANTNSLTGFTSGTLAQLQDTTGDIFNPLDGADIIFAGSGDDVIYGSLGNDIMRGNGGADIYSYSAAADITGDTIDGGSGNDRIQVTVSGNFDFRNAVIASTGTTSIESLFLANITGNANVFFSGSQINGTGLSANLSVTGVNGSVQQINVFTLSGGVDLSGFTFAAWETADIVSIYAGNAPASTSIVGTSVTDSITGGSYVDFINAGSGDDIIYGYGGNDVLLGGAGDDAINGGDDTDYLYSGSGINQLYGDAGLDILISEGSADTMNGGSGDNYYYRQANGTSETIGNDGVDIFVGGNFASNDIFNGFRGNDFALGGAGNDELIGGLGDDILLGGDGNDILDGGLGTNYLYADGTGTDTILINASLASSQTQLIGYFEAGGSTDIIRLNGSTLTSFAGYQALLANLGNVVNGNLLQNVGVGAILTLNLGSANQTDIWFLGIGAYALTSSDFAFV